ERASQLPFSPGDRLLLAAGERHAGSLILTDLKGHPGHPIIVTSVAWPNSNAHEPALIDARGFPQALLIRNCQYIHVESLHIEGNGYFKKQPELTMRCGVLVTATGKNLTEGIILSNIRIHDLFYENPGYQRPPKEV